MCGLLFENFSSKEVWMGFGCREWIGVIWFIYLTAKISFKYWCLSILLHIKKTLTAKIFFKILVSIYFAQCKKTSDEIINHVCLGITQALRLTLKLNQFTCSLKIFGFWREKHRKNCECCPGHCLIVNHYSSMSWFNLNRCLCSHWSHCSQCLLVSTSVY